MKKINIRMQLAILIGSLFFLLLGNAVISRLRALKLLSVSEHLANVDLPAQAEMGTVDMMHDGLRAVVYSANLYAVGASASTPEEISKDLAELSENMKNSLQAAMSLKVEGGIHTKIQSAAPLVEEYLKVSRSTTELFLAKDVKGGEAKYKEFTHVFETLEVSLGAISEDIKLGGKAQQKESAEGASQAAIVFYVINIGGTIFALLFAFFMARKLTSSLNKSMNTMLAIASDAKLNAANVQQGSEVLSGTIAIQATSVQATAATIHEISEMATVSAENADGIRSDVSKSVILATAGKQRVSDLVVVIEEINRALDGMNEQSKSSNDKFASVAKIIQEISDKTQIINEIVFQTKLLSFNASVEAARAGEHGKGFAVVAQEVGALAQTSGKAADEISKMLSSSANQVQEVVAFARTASERALTESREKTNKGQNLAKACDQVLNEVVDSAQSVQRKIDQVSGALKEQTIGIVDMSKALQLLETSLASTKEQAGNSTEQADLMAGISDQVRESVLQETIGLEGPETYQASLGQSKSFARMLSSW